MKLMSINRSGYYAWRKRRGKLNRYEQNRIDLTKLLIEKHQKHKCYGYHNLAEKIREETGWMFSDNLAHKCCKYAGIRSLARKTYHPTKGKEHIKYGNIVAGNWNANEPTQIDILRELTTGALDRDIAKKMEISEQTVHFHVKRILKKTGLKNRTMLAVEARRLGFVIKLDK